MELHRALDRISQIHAHLERTETYRGFRSFPVAVSGLLAMAAGPLHALSGTGFVPYWSAVAALGFVLSTGSVFHRYLFHETPSERRRTRRILGQFLPCLAAGALLTQVLAAEEHLLPGIWAICFSLGLVAARPFLPRGIGALALAYLAAGALLLGKAEASSLDVGLLFGGGQVAAGVLLYLNRERPADG